MVVQSARADTAMHYGEITGINYMGVKTWDMLTGDNDMGRPIWIGMGLMFDFGYRLSETSDAQGHLNMNRFPLDKFAFDLLGLAIGAIDDIKRSDAKQEDVRLNFEAGYEDGLKARAGVTITP